MKNIVVVLLLVVGLSGCETIRHTISGPFVGAEKDISNFKAAASKVNPGESLKKADDWMQKNMW